MPSAAPAPGPPVPSARPADLAPSPADPPSPADALCKAAARGDLPAVQAALADNPALAACVDTRGYSPLAWAALNDQAAVVAALLRAGAPRAAADPAGLTALHWSAARGSVAAAAALLAEAGEASAALLTAPDAQGYSPLHVAAQHDAPAWLHAAAAGWPGGLAGVRAARDGHDRTPLHWAAYKGARDAARLLLALGADPAALDDEGAAPLHWAALKGHTDACLLLVRAGSAGHRVGGAAVLGVRDATGATPADLARSKGFTSLAARLEEEAAKAGVRVRGGGQGPPSRGGGGSGGEDDKLTVAVADAWHPAARRRARGWWATAHLAPLTLGLAAALGWAFEAGVVWAPGAPPPGPGLVTAGLVVGCAVAAGCVLLVLTARTDPGRLPTHPSLGVGGEGPASGDGGVGLPGSSAQPTAATSTTTAPPPSPDARATRQPGDGSTDVLAHPAFAAAARPAPHAAAAHTPPDWARLCVACRAVRPLRAKHCGTTGACIVRYDHYCPWTGCVIGGGNLGPFVAMLACFAGAAGGAAVAAVARLVGVLAAMDAPPHAPTPDAPVYGSRTGAVMGIGLFLLFDGAVALAVGVLAGVQAQQVGSNLTTAEAVGGPAKHPYLRGPTGRGFVNPHDRGSCLRNWADAVGGGWGGGGGGGGGVAPRRGRPKGRARAVASGAPAAAGGGSGSFPPGRPGRRPLVNRAVEMV